jgi:hypothetical protein
MCFENLKDWCCKGVRSILLQGIQCYEYHASMCWIHRTICT